MLQSDGKVVLWVTAPMQTVMHPWWLPCWLLGLMFAGTKTWVDQHFGSQPILALILLPGSHAGVALGELAVFTERFEGNYSRSAAAPC